MIKIVHLGTNERKKVRPLKTHVPIKHNICMWYIHVKYKIKYISKPFVCIPVVHVLHICEILVSTPFNPLVPRSVAGTPGATLSAPFW